MCALLVCWSVRDNKSKIVFHEHTIFIFDCSSPIPSRFFCCLLSIANERFFFQCIQCLDCVFHNLESWFKIMPNKGWSALPLLAAAASMWLKTNFKLQFFNSFLSNFYFIWEYILSCCLYTLSVWFFLWPCENILNQNPPEMTFGFFLCRRKSTNNQLFMFVLSLKITFFWFLRTESVQLTNDHRH